VLVGALFATNVLVPWKLEFPSADLVMRAEVINSGAFVWMSCIVGSTAVAAIAQRVSRARVMLPVELGWMQRVCQGGFHRLRDEVGHVR